MAKSFLGNHSTRGLRNNNPGNLVITNSKWQGKISKEKNTDGKFEQFQNITYGIRAMLKDIIHDVNKGKNTVSKIISEYAPPNENNTKSYIDSVCKSIGVTPHQKLTVINAPFLVALSRAIFKVELGKPHSLIEDSDIIQAINLLGNISTENLIVNTNTNFFF
jgi:hypothetical protein